MKINKRNFEKAIVAQDDDCDYSESGYVACIFPDDTAGIFHYSHCSCFGTWEALSGYGDYSFDDEPLEEREVHAVWTGTKEELYRLAENKRDPSYPTRESIEDDYDHDHLMKVYAQLLSKKE